MNMKTLLGTAAGLMVATGAYAADLPGDAAPAAVDYVKVCDAYGAGFFYIPGTETCLKVGGRVRVSATYTNNGGDLAKSLGGYAYGGKTYSTVTGAVNAAADDNFSSGDVTKNPAVDTPDSIGIRSDAFVGFDARTASDIGTVRSYFELAIDDASRDILVTQAFIQVGYVTVGRHDEVADGDGLYGINDSTWAPGDYTATGASVLVDNLGGGFYVGAGIYGNNDTTVGSESRPTLWTSGEQAEAQYSGIVGITGQSWGSFDVSGVFRSYNSEDNDIFGVKATANLKLIDKLSLRTWAAYTDGGHGANLTTVGGFHAESIVDLALAASYQVTDPLAIYAGVRYQIVDTPAKTSAIYDGADDTIYANIGADYQLAPGLNLQGEVDYGRQNDWNQLTAVTRLVRVW